MAFRFKNLGNAFKDTRLRAFLIVLIVLLVLVIAITYWGFHRANTKTPSGAELKKLPNIESIPGVQQASPEYVRIQQQQNVLAAQRAARLGTAAVPTLTSTSYLGPTDLDSTKNCNVEELRRARLAGVKAEELRCKGCSAAALRAAGYTAGELLNAGFSAKDLKDAGFSAEELRAAGLSASDLAKAGFTPAELAAAGFSTAELTQAGLSEIAKNCNVDAIRQARAKGMTALQIRKMGCSAAAMKAAGFTAAELKAAGFTAGELKQAGFTAGDLAKAGFSAAELRDAGFSAADLKNAGFTPDQLRAAGFSEGELVRAGFSPVEINPPAPAAVAQTTPVIPPVTTATPLPSQGLSAVVPISDDQAASLAALEKIQKRQAQQLSQQQRAEQLSQLSAAMTAQATQLFSSWTPPPTQLVIKAVEPQPQAGTTSTTTTQVSGTAGGKLAEMGKPPGVIIKAGTVMYGVLDTSINSDEKSPILATVVQGELKGAKLVGSFDRVDKKVLVSFKTLNIPGVPNSVSVDAVAIDPDTARTALASDVDNHYLLRYGGLFASSFLTGLGQAISQSGSQQSTGSGGTIVTYDELDPGQKALVALGQVGTQYAAVLGSSFTKPPTIYVDSGSGVGILFMSDATIPAS